MSNEYNIFWFRRDLRIEDNAALYYALKGEYQVRPIFIFDANIIDDLPKDDLRVIFIQKEILRIREELNSFDSDIDIYYGDPIEIWKTLSKDKELKSVFINRDYESYAKERDLTIQNLLSENNISFNDFKDHVIFDNNEIAKADGDPYVVFTPYKNKWLEKIEEGRSNPMDVSYFLKSYPSKKYTDRFLKFNSELPDIVPQLDFDEVDFSYPDKTVDQSTIRNYSSNRDFPAKEGTSKLGLHFRFGTISIREKARKSRELSEVYLSELIWRDFYSNILNHYPKVEKTSFREKYENIEWREDEDDFNKWCNGMTGYPIVDAGMRELNTTGYMHNRVRMIVASFLTKHLLFHWSWGERFFAKKLLDYDLASNNGGWQWAAGTGTDAAPYFRIFNPYTQADKFDKNRVYIKKWIPEIDTPDYPEPMVDHKEARERALAVYKAGL